MLDKISPQEIALERLRRECKKSLRSFIKTFWHIAEPGYTFRNNWHIDCIADHLENIYDIKWLLICIPPRCSKTTLASVMFPAFMWASQPETKFLYASYALELAEDASSKCKQVVESELYQKLYNIQLKDDYAGKRRFDTIQGGTRLATSVGGSVTGYGADIIVCDDAQSVKKTESQLDREAVVRWYYNSFMNRVNDPKKCARVVIGQRVHKEDLAGELLANNRGQLTVLNLPYECKSSKVSLGFPKLNWIDPREEGEPLFEAQFPPETIAQYKYQTDFWLTQYQQTPTDRSETPFCTSLIKWYTQEENFYNLGERKIGKDECFRVMSCDFSTGKKDGDYSGIVTCDISSEGDIIVVNVVRERIRGTEIPERVGYLNQYLQPLYILCEYSNFDIIFAETLRDAGLPVKAEKAVGSKEDRAKPLLYKFDAGKVWFSKDVTNIDKLEQELLEFGGGSHNNHDDMVDALARIAIETSKKVRVRRRDAVQEIALTPEEIYRQMLFADLD